MRHLMATAFTVIASLVSLVACERAIEPPRQSRPELVAALRWLGSHYPGSSAGVTCSGFDERNGMRCCEVSVSVVGQRVLESLRCPGEEDSVEDCYSYDVGRYGCTR